ncbi:phage tail tape measure protein [Streptomyces acidiscabies]|uniref:phage tail tape measure protein n=1 Tax=Streptomyces acidiscabies TaxID=42234 RepID=UPI00073F5F92|nr:phage tail tape measure protein [Streptomyces acidiscabies]GAQ52058.1 phage-related minor tail protein [Streptomyces acidiscabies]
MALQVGELNGIITIDGRGVTPALRRAESALRQSGQRMGSDADQAGERAGQQLGDGIVRGADGRLRNARGRFVAAGRRAGDAVGDGLSDGAASGADDAVDAAGGRLDKLKMIAAAAGAAAGAVLIAGITEALDQGRITGRLGAQLGATPAEAQRYGKLAGKLYADAVTTDFQGAADAISATMRAGIAPPQATEAQLQSLATKVSDLSQTFELDLGQTANAVGQMIKTGLAKDGTEALDALTAGLQQMGPRADDIADTFNEYSTIFRQMGIDATTATGLLSQGMKAGARDTDVVADALKEFVLITQGGGKDVDAAFKAIGLSGKEMQAAFVKGGPAASRALDQVFDGLRNMKPGVDRNNVALALFKTKAEDTQKALFALDPSSATKALGDVGGAADRMGDSLRDNSGVRLEQFKRGLQQGFVEFLGGTVIPAVIRFGGVLKEHGGEIKTAAIIIGAILVPALVVLGTQALIAGGRMAAAWVLALGPIGWIGLAIGALVVLVIAYWDEIKGATVAVWNWIVKAVVWAKDALVSAFLNFTLIGLIIKHWSTIKNATVSAWNATIAWVKGIPGKLYNLFLNWTLLGLIIKHWTAIKTATVSKALEMVAWVKGLPGRISNAMGNLGSLLVGKGRNVVQGLWNGISGMTGWIRGKLIGWAKSAIPGPIAKALGIASPSKVTKAQGRWIAQGLIAGLTGSTKQIKAASGKVSDILADSLRPGKARTAALKSLGTGTKKLLALASQEEKVAARLKDAQKRYADLIAARDKLAADVTKGVLDGANITQQQGSEGDSAESILDGLRANRRAAERFAADLAKLRSKGVSADLVTQIAQAGVAQGASAAAALANASTAQIKAINAEQGALVKAAGRAGATAGDAMYGAGIQAAAGLVRGLQSQQRAIEQQMLRIAQSMTKSIRKSLGIKSPSRVMALVGRYTAQGLIRGVEGQRSAVNQSMASLVDTPAPGEWASGARAQGAAGRGQSPKVVRLGSDGSAFGNLLVGELRKKVQAVGGGDVQLVLGRR